MRVGLFGGSFNPPHEGHKLVAETALRRLRLDKVWWLVTPGNPLKDVSTLPAQETRMAACRAMLGRDPRHVITGLEAAIGTRYTQETIAHLIKHGRNVHFVWLMGADNLASFHHWQRWQNIAAMVPFAVIDRPSATFRAASSPAAHRLAKFRLDESDAGMLVRRNPPAWVMLHGKRSPLSSTLLRGKTT